MIFKAQVNIIGHWYTVVMGNDTQCSLDGDLNDLKKTFVRNMIL